MKSKNLIVITSFIALGLVSILPPIIHGYWYPNLSDDTANHLSVIIRLVNGTLPSFEFRYLGYAIIGYPMHWVSQIFNVGMTTLFLWLHCLIPLIAGSVLYFVFSRLVGWITGLLAMIVPIFVSGASVYYMYYGLIFNFINVLILYPLLIYFVIKWIMERKGYQMALAIFFAVLVGTFHVSGLYLPVIAGFILVVYLIWSFKTKNRICNRKLVIGVCIAIVGVICVMLVPYTRQQIIDAYHHLFGATLLPTEKSQQMDEIYRAITPHWYYIKEFVGIFILAMFAVAIWKYKTISQYFTTQIRILVFILACWAIVLLIVAYVGLSTIPFRQQTDLAIVIAILTAVLVGILVKENKKWLVVFGVLICIGLYSQFIPTWFQDNSAIKEVDKQTIEYLNTLDLDGYDCSPTVSYPIYDLFVKGKYNSDSDILVVRNKAMTQGSDVDNPYWDGHGKQSTVGFRLINFFDDDGIKVEVFKKIR